MSIFRLFHRHPNRESYLRNFIFGVEDSLVSTVGLLAGIATAEISNQAILTTGLVLIVVEGFSMGVGSFLTEETTQEMAGQTPQTLQAVKGAFIMLISYCLAGLIPLSPYIFLKNTSAVLTSVLLSLFGLFVLGFGTSKYYDRPNPVRHAIRMLVLGGSAVLVGMLVGKAFHL